MSIATTYYEEVTKILSGIVETQQNQIKKDANILAQAVTDGKPLNFIGPGGDRNNLKNLDKHLGTLSDL